MYNIPDLLVCREDRTMHASRRLAVLGVAVLALLSLAPVTARAGGPSPEGYWLVASDGGVFGFGDAGFHGSTGAERLARPIVGLAASPTGNGYWLVASDGGVFSFGDAGYHGGLGGSPPRNPIVGVVSAG
jgi:hypothetical protein